MLGTLDINVSPSTPSTGSASSTADPSVLVVSLTGDLDISTLSALEEKMIPLLKDLSYKAFIFNLKDLKFMDSKGIGFFVYAYTTLNHGQRAMAIAEYSPALKDILTIVGLMKIIPCYPTLNEAMKKMELTPPSQS